MEPVLDEVATRLSAELDRLIAELTVHIPSHFGEDQDGASYAVLIARQSETRRRIKLHRKVLSELPEIPGALVLRDRIGFGSAISLQDLDSGAIGHFRMTADRRCDLAGGEISVHCHLGQRLFGSRQGEWIDFADAPERRLRILDVRTLHDDFSTLDRPQAERRRTGQPSFEMVHHVACR